MSTPRRYRLELVDDDGEGDEGDMRLVDTLTLLSRMGFRVVGVQTQHKPTQAARERVATLIEGEEWDSSITRFLKGVWLMDREQVSEILRRCIMDPATRGESLRLAEEWL